MTGYVVLCALTQYERFEPLHFAVNYKPAENQISEDMPRSKILDLDLMLFIVSSNVIKQLLETTDSLEFFSLRVEDTYNRDHESSRIIHPLIAQTNQSLKILSLDWDPFWENGARFSFGGILHGKFVGI